MSEYALGLAFSFWFGILTSISPCPLSTNIAAISFITRRVTGSKETLIAGTAYSLGRMFAYSVLALIVINGILGIPTLSLFLQKYLNLFLGPILIIVGMLLIEILTLNIRGIHLSEKLQQRLTGGGVSSNFLLGSLFALTFCPVSAALFFGSLIPLAIKLNAPVAPALAFGFATALPVVLVTLFLLAGIKSIASLFNTITKIEKWIRLGTGSIIILIGIYLTLTNIFEILAD